MGIFVRSSENLGIGIRVESELSRHDDAGGVVIIDRSEEVLTYIPTASEQLTIARIYLSSTTVGSRLIERDGKFKLQPIWN